MTNAERQHLFRERHPQRVKKWRRYYQKNNRFWLKFIMDLFKSTEPCMDCGLIFPPECMEWDHRKGKRKFYIADTHSYGKKTLQQEIAKCDLVCANCHRIRTKVRI